MTTPRDWDSRSVVAAKRDGRSLPAGEIEAFIEGFTEGSVPEPLAAAFLMAAYIRGMDADETFELTRAMVASGRTVSLEGVSRPTVDKHSTGGVGDGVTLVFAPLAASLGLGVVKLSGRGLGHTGGTIDKLESIPGLRTQLGPEDLVRQVEDVGCVVASQSADLVPADAAMYALREATATVDSVPLLASSVMSKKLAVETDLVLLDVKAGGGAFMTSPEAAGELASACIDLAARWERRVRAAITDMSQPLGTAIGNALEVAEAVAVLSGEGKGRLRELTVLFAVEALSMLTGVPRDEAASSADEALSSGKALESFGRMIEAQGGDPRVCEDPGAVLPGAPVVLPVLADRTGFVSRVDALALGTFAVDLGAGRRTKGAPVDPAVGIVFRPAVGDRIESGEVIGAVHALDEAQAQLVSARVLAALDVVGDPVEAPPLVHALHGADGR